MIDLKLTITDSHIPDYRVNADLTGAKTYRQLLDLVRLVHADISKQVLSEARAKGFDQKALKVVDGRPNKEETDVKPFGVIEYKSRVLGAEVLLPLYDDLRFLSPVSSSFYKDYHWVYFNGILVADSRETFVTFLKNNRLVDGDYFQFVNVAPYAGFLERSGVTVAGIKFRTRKSRDERQRSGPRVRTPNGVYYQAYLLFRNKIKGQAFASFRWINGGQIGLNNLPTRSRRGAKLRNTFADNKINKEFSRVGSPYVYPSIRVYFRGGSLL